MKVLPKPVGKTTCKKMHKKLIILKKKKKTTHRDTQIKRMRKIINQPKYFWKVILVKRWAGNVAADNLSDKSKCVPSLNRNHCTWDRCEVWMNSLSDRTVRPSISERTHPEINSIHCHPHHFHLLYFCCLSMTAKRSFLLSGRKKINLNILNFLLCLQTLNAHTSHNIVETISKRLTTAISNVNIIWTVNVCT